MRCTFNKILISRYVDGDVSEEEKKIVENHVGTCDKCSTIFRSYTGISLILEKSFSLEKSPDTAAVRINQQFRYLWAYRMAALLVLSISITAGIFLFSHTAGSPQNINVLTGKEIQTIMNSPLGALTYYETATGEKVQQQFSDNRQETVLTMYTQSEYQSFSYKSPLFNDTTTLNYRDKSGNTYLY